MYRILLLLIMLTSLSLSKTFAQSDVNIGMHVDPLIQFAITPDEDKNKGIGGGIHYGLMLDWNFSDRFTLNTGVGGSYNTFKLENVSLHNLETENDLILPMSRTKLKVQYVEIPVNLKLRTNDINNYNVYALFGFTNRINIAGRANVRPGGNKDLDFDTKIKKDVAIYDIPFNVGGGVHWFIKDNLRAVFGIEYSHGLIDITKYDNSRVTLSTLKLRIGILF